MIRKDNSIEILLDSIEELNDKKAIRDFLLGQWIKEEQEKKYRYFVEELNNGKRIYLERPGQLNKGCDFVIFVENQILFKNQNDKPPKHDYILSDIRLKKEQFSNEEFNLFIYLIEKIYLCNSFDSISSDINNLPKVGIDNDIILKLLKWFFIEQDITYWAKSGRKMLFNAINSI